MKVNRTAKPGHGLERSSLASSEGRAAYCEAIAHFATGVAVITTSDEAGRPVGMTASAVSSLSLDPVLLLVCISSQLPTGHAIAKHGSFVVNVLGIDDGSVATHFATPASDKFANVATSLDPDRDVPLLDCAIAHFVCDVEQRVAGGDHTIFIGRVTACGCMTGREPLLYFRSGFGRFVPPGEEHRLAAEVMWQATG